MYKLSWIQNFSALIREYVTTIFSCPWIALFYSRRCEEKFFGTPAAHTELSEFLYHQYSSFCLLSPLNALLGTSVVTFG